MTLENTTIDMLGTAEKVEIDKDNTTIVNGKGKKADVEGRVKQIQAEIDAIYFIVMINFVFHKVVEALIKISFHALTVASLSLLLWFGQCCL